MIDVAKLEEAIHSNLPYTANHQQLQLIGILSRFCILPEYQDKIFILNGYAGTGKTSLTSALVNSLESFGVKCVLLAPTGRAAKVFGSFSRHKAYTIHRFIYRFDPLSGQFGSIKENRAKAGTVFLVDEASMIDTADNESKAMNLLDDLLQFVYTGNNCRLIFLGDTAQLPPVGNESASSLHKALRDRHFHVLRAVLTSTVRQAADSGILYNATWLRKSMEKEHIPLPKIFAEQFEDVQIISGEELPDLLQRAYSIYGKEQSIIITRANKRAVDYNMAVRNIILEYTSLISKGDILMIAKNNYFWSAKVKGLEFIANGDMAVVEKIYGEETLGEFRFADVELSFPDHDDIRIEAKINLSSLLSDSPALSNAEMRALSMACLESMGAFSAGTQVNAAAMLRNDPLYNALQVKYGYAITCHKAQGGQWNAVFLDIGFVPEDIDRHEFYRWLYTAVTRASKELYIINPQILVE